MKKKTKIILIGTTAMAFAIAAGTVIYRGMLPDTPTIIAEETENGKANSEVIVDINTKFDDIPEYKEIIDDETGEKAVAEVQVNDPIENKSTTPPEKPKSEESYTNSEKPPTYKKEQTVVEKKTQISTESKTDKSLTSGKVYVDGFGYVDKAGETRTQTGVSDGDINKMVGSMD